MADRVKEFARQIKVMTFEELCDVAETYLALTRNEEIKPDQYLTCASDLNKLADVLLDREDAEAGSDNL